MGVGHDSAESGAVGVQRVSVRLESVDVHVPRGVSCHDSVHVSAGRVSGYDIG